MRLAAVAWLVAAAAAGCNTTRFMANSMVGMLEASKLAFNRERSVEQAREALPAAASTIDGLIVASPHNPELLLAGAETHATGAFGLIEPDDPERARIMYDKARRYAARALAEQDAELAETVVRGRLEEVQRALAEIEPGDERIPALFWTAFAWGSYINLSLDRPDVVAALPAVVAIMERLAEVAPDYFHAGPHLFLAVYYSSRGPAVGGELERARRHYHEVFTRTRGRLLMPYVLYAQLYCVALGGSEPERARAQFTKALRWVLDAPDDIHPDQILANAIAKRRAAELLPELDDLIFPPLPPEDG
ncbi:MAG: hypothetical protein KatS3mg102_1339 [Planctomycetota bacterium]|nr:MAG: hypothetical protein KatS3mg102_1339 [Planctomycetota bacterium]